MNRYQLDARRLLCPLPVIRAQDKVTTLAPGDLLEVIATDRGAMNDIPAWCRVHGHRVIETRQSGNEVTVVIQVGAKV